MMYVQWGGSPVEGCLELLDVAGECMLAWSETLRGVDEWQVYEAAAWHPSSAAIPDLPNWQVLCRCLLRQLPLAGK